MENSLEYRFKSVENRLCKHGEEIDRLNILVYEGQSNQAILGEQLKVLNEIKENINKMSDSILDIKENQTRLSSQMNNLENANERYKEQLIIIEQNVANLKKQRDADHKDKPLSIISRIFWITISIIIAYILGKYGIK